MNEPAFQPADTDGGSAWRLAIVFIAALFVLPLLAAHAPSRVKLIGIFPVAVGIATAYLLLLVHARLPLSNLAVRSLAVIVVPLALGVFAVESYRAWRSDHREMFTEHLLSQPGGRGILDQLGGETVADPAMRELLAPYRNHLNPPPAWYLDERLSGLPDGLTSRGEIIVTIVELLLAAIAGIGVVFWNTRQSDISREASTS